jgi:DNA polymerase III delta subunit
MVYLFIGEDVISKKRKLDSLKRELFSPATGEFDYHILYAKEIDLLKFKELLRTSTFAQNKRLIVIKDVLNLNNQLREFILSYLKEQDPKIHLVMDIEDFNLKDGFIQEVIKYAKVFRFRRPKRFNTFDLAMALEKKDLILSLSILSKLLFQGEEPEKILGGLRYQWVKDDSLEFRERKKRLSLLLDTDLLLKKSQLRAEFALELLITKLCNSS